MEVMLSEEVLGNFGVMSASVITIVEAIKKVISCITNKKVPDKVSIITALIVSFIISFGYTAYMGNWSVLTIFLTIGNAFGIFGASTAGYRAVKDEVKKRTEGGV